jgi:hypothetical protein
MGGAWAAHSDLKNEVPVLLTGLTAGADGALPYSLETDAVSGIFLVDAAGVETRLFHTADVRVRHAALHPREGSWLPLRSIRTTCNPTLPCCRCKEQTSPR